MYAACWALLKFFLRIIIATKAATLLLKGRSLQTASVEVLLCAGPFMRIARAAQLLELEEAFALVV